jgi:hypothetical protein
LLKLGIDPFNRNINRNTVTGSVKIRTKITQSKVKCKAGEVVEEVLTEFLSYIRG